MSESNDAEPTEPQAIEPQVIEPMRIDPDLIRQMAALIDERHLTEIEVHDGKRSIRVSRATTTVAAAPAPVVAAPPAAASSAAPPAADAAPAPMAVDTTNALKSPMVGTAYLATEPGAKPFISVGDTVTPGQTVLIIEAMKVMNPIAATHGGRVSRICVENGQPVEFDQSLVIFE